MPASRPSRRLRLLAVAALVIALVAFPLGAWAGHQFADVPDSNQFHGDIDAITDAGVTSGCGGANYCPSAFVTREQMAAFMNRLGALSTGKTPVVNAAKLGGLDSSAFMPSGDIVTQHHGPWAGAYAVGPTVSYGNTSMTLSWTEAAADRIAVLSLPAPSAIGGTTYGLKEIEICHLDSENADIDATKVLDTAISGTSTPIDDQTDRPLTAPGCYTVAPPGGVGAVIGVMQLWLQIDFTGAGYIGIVSVRATWAPVAP